MYLHGTARWEAKRSDGVPGVPLRNQSVSNHRVRQGGNSVIGALRPGNQPMRGTEAVTGDIKAPAQRPVCSGGVHLRSERQTSRRDIRRAQERRAVSASRHYGRRGLLCSRRRDLCSSVDRKTHGFDQSGPADHRYAGCIGHQFFRIVALRHGGALGKPLPARGVHAVEQASVVNDVIRRG